MSLVSLSIESEELVEGLKAKRAMLEAALTETIGTLGAQLLELTQANLSGAVLQTITGVLLSAVTLQAAEFAGQVCQTSVGIDDGDPSWIVGMTHEYGGTSWYDIYPVQAQSLAFLGGEGNMVFTKHVHHPPAQERSWLRSALAEIEADAVAQIKATIAEVMAA